jgi:leucyl aminopeptidase
MVLCEKAVKPFGEMIGQLPLVDEYESYVDSKYADVCIISSGGGAGAITAVLILLDFVHLSFVYQSHLWHS